MPEATLLEPSRVESHARKVTFTDLADRHAPVLLALYSVIYFVGALAAASRKPFWFDEISTVWIAQLPRLSDIWEALRQGIEMNPPTFLSLMWVLHRIAGTGHIVSRLPAAFGYWLMSICIYHFVRRRTRPAYGWIALIFPLFTTAAAFSIEARGYGLELGFAGVALLSWQRAADQSRRALALAGIALGTAAAVSCHYYAAYLVVALAVGETVRSRVRRHVDWPCILAILAGFVPLLAFLPLILVVAALSNTVWATPSIKGLLWFYFGALTPALILGLPLLVYLAGPKRKMDAPCAETQAVLPVWELTTVAMLAAMPLIVYIAAIWLHIGVWDRYLLLTIPGLAILLPATLYQLTNGSASAPDFVLKTAFFFCFVPWAIFRGYGLYLEPPPTERVQRQAIIPRAQGLNVALSDELVFLQDYYYLPRERTKQLCLLLDLDAAARYSGQNVGLRSLARGRRWWPLPAYNYQEFVARNPEFLLVQSDGPDWLMQKLLNDGAELKLLEDRHGPGIFQAKTEIFFVRVRKPLPGRAPN